MLFTDLQGPIWPAYIEFTMTLEFLDIELSMKELLCLILDSLVFSQQSLAKVSRVSNCLSLSGKLPT